MRLRAKTAVQTLAATACAVAATSAVAQTTLLTDVQMRRLPVEQSLRAVHTNNPAVMWHADTMALAEFAVGGEYLGSDEAVMEQMGTGHKLLSIEAAAYKPMNVNNTLWGSCGFTTGTADDVRWTDCIDYERIAPYVLGDEAGGDLSMRRYTLSGGYVYKRGRVGVGAQVDYRAEIAYRNIDPRIKTVVSDLTAALGTSLDVADSYIAGLTVRLNSYNQNCDLDFYNPTNDINTYTLTGLGTYYERFMGNTNKNSGYEAIGYAVGLQLIPGRRSGLIVTLDYSHYRMEQLLRNYNNLTLGYCDNEILSGAIGFVTDVRRNVRLMPYVTALYRSRKGTENLFGTAVGASYDKMGSREPYSSTDMNIKLTCPVQIGIDASYLTITPLVQYVTSEEKYTETTVQQLKSSMLEPGIGGRYSFTGGRLWLFDVGFSYKYGIGSDKQHRLTSTEAPTALLESVERSFAMKTSDRTRCECSAAVTRSFGKLLLTLNAGYVRTNYSGHGSSDCAGLTISTTF